MTGNGKFFGKFWRKKEPSRFAVAKGDGGWCVYIAGKFSLSSKAIKITFPQVMHTGIPIDKAIPA